MIFNKEVKEREMNQLIKRIKYFEQMHGIFQYDPRWDLIDYFTRSAEIAWEYVGKIKKGEYGG